MLVRLAHNETLRVSVAQISVLSTRTRARQGQIGATRAPEASREAGEVGTPKRGAAPMNDRIHPFASVGSNHMWWSPPDRLTGASIRTALRSASSPQLP